MGVALAVEDVVLLVLFGFNDFLVVLSSKVSNLCHMSLKSLTIVPRIMQYGQKNTMEQRTTEN